MRRKRAIASFLAGMLLVGGGFIGLSPVRAQEAADFGGFDLSATGSAARFILTPRSNIIPVPDLLDVSLPYTLADLTGSPAGHANASMLWPGPVVADACQAYPTFPPDERWPFPIETPCYEVRAETFYPQGPQEAKYTDFPGATMEAKTTATESIALAEFTPQGVPGISIGPVSSRSASYVKDGKAIAESVSKVSNIVIGNGDLVIDSVVSTVIVSSDGEKATAEARTIVTGARSGDQGLVIDEGGIHAGGQNADPLGQVLGPVVPRLEDQGITASLTKPVRSGEGREVEVVAGGLIVQVNNTTIIDALPPEVVAQLPADPAGKATLVFGQAAAAANAAPGFGQLSEVAPVDEAAPPEVLPLEGGLADSPVSGDVSLAAEAPAPATGGEPTAATAEPAGRTGMVPGAAIGFGLILMALALSAVAGNGLKRVADGALIAKPATVCPKEGA